MVDTVTTIPLLQGGRRYAVHLECVSDGTGETNVRKVDLSGLRTTTGQIPVSVALTDISFNVEGFTDVILYWQRDGANIPMVTLKGRGSISYASYGGLLDPNRSGTGTGDILLSSVGAVSGATYQIDLEFRLKNK